MTTMLQLPAALEAAGVNVRVLDGWDKPHVYDGKDYVYREVGGDPAGHMHHHTAGGHYDPNRAKANGYAGLSYFGSQILYQERYNEGDYKPIYTIANAYPAPISSGAGDYSVLQRVRENIEVVGRQGPDTPKWYGNTHYWNTEWVCKGDGSPLDEAVWEMMLVVCNVQNDLMSTGGVLWTPNRHIAHGHHTKRKIDLWGGQFSGHAYDGFTKTVEALRADMTKLKEQGMWVNDWTDKSWMTWFDDTNIPNVIGSGRYYCSNDGSYTFNPPWGEGPKDANGVCMDGKASYAEKVNAINYVFSGFALALDQG